MPKTHNRYEIRPIRYADQRSLGHVVATASRPHTARSRAEAIAGQFYYGVAIVDKLAQTVYGGLDTYPLSECDVPPPPTWDDICRRSGARREQVAEYRTTWPDGDGPDQSCIVAVEVIGDLYAGGYVLDVTTAEGHMDGVYAPDVVYPTFRRARIAGRKLAKERHEPRFRRPRGTRCE